MVNLYQSHSDDASMWILPLDEKPSNAGFLFSYADPEEAAEEALNILAEQYPDKDTEELMGMIINKA